jgi:hypothetical protein
MTKEQLVAQLKLEYPVLTYGINEEVFEMTADQYEQTISDWADARISKAQAKADVEQAKIEAESKLAALGLTTNDFKALGI